MPEIELNVRAIRATLLELPPDVAARIALAEIRRRQALEAAGLLGIVDELERRADDALINGRGLDG